jgi:16S rRNA (guanine1516-N2)-methyltransferase
VKLAVTSPLDATAADEEIARLAAARHGLPFAARSGGSLAAAAARAGADALLVLAARHAALFVDGAEHPWRAGMAALRVKRLLSGERVTVDGFLAAARLRPGDAVLDATLGLGMDALVAAAAVGTRGRVVGVEASRALAALAAEGLARCGVDASRRVEVVHAEAGALLASLPARSFDVVVFDPMFRFGRAGASGFDLVRRLADSRPLAPETLARARQVARRWVVVKDGTPGWDLVRLGLEPLPSARGAKKLYARVEASP